MPSTQPRSEPRRPAGERGRLQTSDVEAIEKLKAQARQQLQNILEGYRTYYQKWDEERQKYMKLRQDPHADPAKKTNAKNRTEHAAAKCHHYKRKHITPIRDNATNNINLNDETLIEIRRRLINLGSDLPTEVCDYIAVLSEPHWTELVGGQETYDNVVQLPPRRYNK